MCVQTSTFPVDFDQCPSQPFEPKSNNQDQSDKLVGSFNFTMEDFVLPEEGRRNSYFSSDNQEAILKTAQHRPRSGSVDTIMKTVSHFIESPHSKVFADGLDLSLRLPADDEDSIYIDFLDEDIWADDDIHQPTTFSGTKRCYEDSFLDLIERSLESRRESSVFSLSQLSNSMDLEHDEGEEAKKLTMQSQALMPLTSIAIPSASQSNKRIKTHHTKDETVVGKATQQLHALKRLKLSMRDSTKTQKSLQEWDRKNGLPASHCQTMVNSARSREQLQSGMVLQKWNGMPLLMIPGARVKVTRRQFRGVKVTAIE